MSPMFWRSWPNCSATKIRDYKTFNLLLRADLGWSVGLGCCGKAWWRESHQGVCTDTSDDSQLQKIPRGRPDNRTEAKEWWCPCSAQCGHRIGKDGSGAPGSCATCSLSPCDGAFDAWDFHRWPCCAAGFCHCLCISCRGLQSNDPSKPNKYAEANVLQQSSQGNYRRLMSTTWISIDLKIGTKLQHRAAARGVCGSIVCRVGLHSGPTHSGALVCSRSTDSGQS